MHAAGGHLFKVRRVALCPAQGVSLCLLQASDLHMHEVNMTDKTHLAFGSRLLHALFVCAMHFLLCAKGGRRHIVLMFVSCFL